MNKGQLSDYLFMVSSACTLNVLIKRNELKYNTKCSLDGIASDFISPTSQYLGGKDFYGNI